MAVVSTFNVTPSASFVVDLDRFISRAGLEHLRAKQEPLRREVERARQDLSEVSHKDTGALTDAKHRYHSLQHNLEENERFIRDAMVIEDADEFRQRPDAVIWLGCAVSFVDDEGEGFIALLNARERESRGKHVIEACLRVHQGGPVCDQAEIAASCTSQLAQALLGHRAGDTIEYMTPWGPHYVQILAVTPLL